MTESKDQTPVISRSKPRKPGVAANLSFALTGLGQIYCGCFRRGLLHLCATAAVLVVVIVLLASQVGSPVAVCLAGGAIGLLFTCYSAYDARQLARRTREDYRLKEYNSPGVYLGITFLFLTLVCGLGVTLRENFVEVYHIPSESMSPTIPKNSKILVRKDAFAGHDPERNDIVVLRNPANRRQTWIKRVVGLPGDTVVIRDGIVYVNGSPFKEATTVQPDHYDTEETFVPDGHCYVLGDHRMISKDSRQIGPVPMIALIGKMVFPRRM